MKRFVKKIVLLWGVIAMLAGFTSCDVGSDGYWWGPDDSGTFYDNELLGTWRLIEINEVPVSRYDTHYMEFMRNGYGYYYFYKGNLEIDQRILWVCNAGARRDTVTVRYEDGYTSTMYYYFTDGGNYLYLNWTTYQGEHMSYCYRYMGTSSPW